MKQPRKLTRAEKIAASAAGLDPRAYAVEKVEEGLLHLIHRKSGRRKTVSL